MHTLIACRGYYWLSIKKTKEGYKYLALSPGPSQHVRMAWYTLIARAFICTQYLGTLYIPIKYLVNCLFRTTSSFLVCLCVANEHTMRAQRVCSSGWHMEFQSGQTCQPCPTVLSRCNYWSVHLTIDLCIWGWPIIITENFNLHMHLDNTFG